ncbi:MAG: GTPase domain-containing protein [Myxococcota bacterium]
MATINFATREIQAKVVYFGATGAGCTTNIEGLHARVVGRRKSALHGFGFGDSAERSWYFEYATHSPFEGFELLMRVYCLPGAIELEVHRHEVMADADGVVLVADARTDKNRDNVDALLTLESLLKTMGRELSLLPVVIQVNHTDADLARPVADVVFDLNPFGFPVVSAVARNGTGVIETHHEILTALRERSKNALTGQRPGLVLTAIHDAHRASDGDVIQSHVEAIHHRASATPVIAGEPPPPEPWLELLDGPVVEVAFQPRELVGSHPVEVLAAEVDDDRVRVELVMRRMGGSEQWRTVVYLLNRPADTMSPTRIAPREGELDEVIPLHEFEAMVGEPAEEEEEEEASADLPGVTYGAVGVAGGLAIGWLSAYLAGFV